MLISTKPENSPLLFLFCFKSVDLQKHSARRDERLSKKHAVRLKGEECTFNLEDSCEGENICPVCFQQLDALIFVLVQLKKEKSPELLLFLSEWYQTISLIALSFSSVHLCLDMSL